MPIPKRYIVMLGSAGARTALLLADLHRDEIQKRFPKRFLSKEAELRAEVRALSEWKPLPLPFYKMEQEAVFPALWQLAEQEKAGLVVELSRIAISSFAIEVTELFDCNPYVNPTEKLVSSKAETTEPQACQRIYGYLFVTTEPRELLEAAEQDKLSAAIIGELTEDKARLIRNGEILRYLTANG